jgi:hypothetical protein
MQIKFNKLVKPVVPLSEGELSAMPAETNQSAIDQALASQAPEEEQKMAEAPVVNEAPAFEEAPVAAPAPAMSAAELSSLEDTMRKFVGKQIRIYMADHEYVAGMLDTVDNGWVKITNARSAGSDYYFDEDIINTCNIVRVRVTVPIDKKQYVEFMNSTK